MPAPVSARHLLPAAELSPRAPGAPSPHRLIPSRSAAPEAVFRVAGPSKPGRSGCRAAPPWEPRPRRPHPHGRLRSALKLTGSGRAAGTGPRRPTGTQGGRRVSAGPRAPVGPLSRGTAPAGPGAHVADARQVRDGSSMWNKMPLSCARSATGRMNWRASRRISTQLLSGASRQAAPKVVMKPNCGTAG